MPPPSLLLSSLSDLSIQPVTTTILIPGLPNDVSSLILAFIPYPHHSRLKPTSKSWLRFFSSPKSLFSLRHIYTHPPQLLLIFPKDPSISHPYIFDPKLLSWSQLPLMPCNPHVYGLSNFISTSIGPTFYILGGSLFDTRSFPLDRPTPSRSVFKFDFVTMSWRKLRDMITPRGSFACGVLNNDNGIGNRIVVAGGGDRHSMFGAAGSRVESVEVYDVGKDEWVEMEGLPRFRAGCEGFVIGKEFWVMGGYGEERTFNGVFPVDEWYRDGVVLGEGGRWREVGDMWGDGERTRLGKVVVVGDGVFMLDRNEIFRYDMPYNRWVTETCVPKKVSSTASVGFISLDGELHLLTHSYARDSANGRRSLQQKRSTVLLIQIYHPGRRTWRSVISKPPFHDPLDFKTAVMCTIQL